MVCITEGCAVENCVLSSKSTGILPFGVCLMFGVVVFVDVFPHDI